MKLYDENNCLVNLSNSILKYYKLPCFHNSIKVIDEQLAKKKYKKIVVCLFDGLASYIQDLHLTKNDIIIRNRFHQITSIFPPTTVAATTAFLSAKFPKETGWLGWNQYFKDLDATVDMFSGRDSFTRDFYIPSPSAKYLKYESIIEQINKNTKVYAKAIYPFGVNDGYVKTLDELKEQLNNELANNNDCFYYVYWKDPDSTIHNMGVNHPLTHRTIKEINQFTAKISKENKDTLFIIIADHGLIDCESISLDEHIDFYDLLIKDSSLDARTVSFRIKNPDTNKQLFKELFLKYYAKDFDLYSKQEAIDNNLFGIGNAHPCFEDFLGDFIAICKTNKRIDSPLSPQKNLVAAHSGNSNEEKLIYISLINK